MALVKTGVLLAAMTALFGAVGLMLGGQQGLVIAAGGGGGDERVLVVELGPHGAADVRGPPGRCAHRARAAPDDRRDGGAGRPADAEALRDRDEQPNAFATGRSPQNAAVAVTSGLLRRMSPEQVAGVVAHELAHIRNRDTLLMTVTATFAGAIALLANFALFFGGGRDRPMGLAGTLALMLLAPLAAGLVQAAISRTREYEADRIGAEICGRPDWLADALERLGGLASRIDNRRAERNPAAAHLFIANPLHLHGYDRLFATHPPMGRRVALLRQMAGEPAAAPVRPAPGPGPRRPAGPWG